MRQLISLSRLRSVFKSNSIEVWILFRIHPHFTNVEQD